MSKDGNRTISFAELAEHKTAQSCWLTINDSVYDVTKYIDEHPGGEDVLFENAAKYATAYFVEAGHSTDAKELLESYKIGVLAESDKEANAKATPESPKGGSSIIKWLIPLGIALAAAIVYKVVLSKTSN